MKTWIVTGGAATGKSQLCGILRVLRPGTPVVSSDELVHQIYGTRAFDAAITEAFGTAVINEQGGVNREAIRSIIFADDQARLKLEKILHPPVFQQMSEARQKASEAGEQLFIAEIPLFYEAGQTFPADLVIVVAAGNACQLLRMINERGLDQDTASRILAAQLPLASKLERAQAVIWNEGAPELLKSQAKILLDQLSPIQ